MNKTEYFEAIRNIALHKQAIDKLYASVDEDYPHSEYGFDPFSAKLIKGCYVHDDVLYGKDGKKMATGGLVDGLYFVDQSTGYCEDDFYGNMYFPVGEGEYVKVYYAC